MDALRLEGISKYYLKNLILEDIACSIPFGTTIIRGKNGAGKSTLLKIIAGITDADSGSITRSSTLQNARLAYFAHGTGLYPQLSVIENFKFFAQLYNTDSTSLSSLLECWGLTALQHRLVGTLSAGEQAKVGIARTFLGSPGILIFDEPTAFLDLEATRWFEQALQLLNHQNQVALIATHDLERLQLQNIPMLALQGGRLLPC